MRGVAALVVVFYHLKFGAPVLLPFEEATRLFARGYLWVDFFFVLSGFVLTYVYGGTRWDTGSVKRFYVARIARVYPLHLATLGLLVAYQVATIALAAAVPSVDARLDQPWAAIPFHLLLVQAWGFLPEPFWNIPAWSISTELFAYLLFPLFATALAASRGAFLTAASVGALAFYAWIGGTTGSLDVTVGLALVRCVAGFVLGMVLCELSPRVGSLPGALLSAAQLAAVIAIAVLIERADNDVLLIVPFMVLVLTTTTDRGIVARALSVGPLQRLGELSYSIYLLHVPVIWIFGTVWARTTPYLGLSPMVARTVFILTVLAITLIGARFTYALIEVPARRALTARFARTPRRMVPAP